MLHWFTKNLGALDTYTCLVISVSVSQRTTAQDMTLIFDTEELGLIHNMSRIPLRLITASKMFLERFTRRRIL